jgi:hypothetical protein
MLAQALRRAAPDQSADRRADHGHDRRPAPAATAPPAFGEAYADLCSRIWSELATLDDAVASAVAHEADERHRDLGLDAEILRLELIVLVDSCRSARWRLSLLTAEQCDRMCSMLTDVLAALYVDEDGLAAGLADAKDRVLEEFMTATERPGPGAVTCRCGQPLAGPALSGQRPRGQLLTCDTRAGRSGSAGNRLAPAPRWRRVG